MQDWPPRIMAPFQCFQQTSWRAFTRSRYELSRRRRRSATPTPVGARWKATPPGGIHESRVTELPDCSRGISVGGATELHGRRCSQSPGGGRRDCFLSDRTCLSFSRRCFAPRDGALALRFVGATATLRSNSTSLLRQSCVLRPWSR